jgi:hypothetical protein
MARTERCALSMVITHVIVRRSVALVEGATEEEEGMDGCAAARPLESISEPDRSSLQGACKPELSSIPSRAKCCLFPSTKADDILESDARTS